MLDLSQKASLRKMKPKKKSGPKQHQAFFGHNKPAASTSLGVKLGVGQVGGSETRNRTIATNGTQTLPISIMPSTKSISENYGCVGTGKGISTQINLAEGSGMYSENKVGNQIRFPLEKKDLSGI